MFKFLRKTALWIVLSPLALGFFGVASNQAVLIANHDKFPVMWNSYKALHYAESIAKAVQSDDEDVSAQAQFDLDALVKGGYLDDTHVLMTSNTHLNFLADCIDLKSATYSIGDLLQMLAEWSWEYAVTIWLVVVAQKLRKQE